MDVSSPGLLMVQLFAVDLLYEECGFEMGFDHIVCSSLYEMVSKNTQSCTAERTATQLCTTNLINVLATAVKNAMSDRSRQHASWH